MADEVPSVLIPPGSLGKITAFPLLVGISVLVVAATLLLIVAQRFDPTQGPLTISLIVLLLFGAAVLFSLVYTVPQDQTTAAVIGGLTAALGAVITFWLAARK
jgi:membrane-bound ClpP family serine protease